MAVSAERPVVFSRPVAERLLRMLRQHEGGGNTGETGRRNRPLPPNVRWPVFRGVLDSDVTAGNSAVVSRWDSGGDTGTNDTVYFVIGDGASGDKVYYVWIGDFDRYEAIGKEC